MTKTELLELIRNGENSGVEFKRDTLQNFDLAKELVAFSNSNGGCVLLGIDDDGSIAGLTRGNIEEWVMTTCRTKIRPEIIPFFEIIKDADAGKDVAVVSVDVGWTVHCRWHDNHSTYYIRVGSQSREASKEELERLFQQRGAFRLEVRPVTGSSIDDLDIRRLKDYFQRVRKQDIPHDEDMTGWKQLLINTEIMTNAGEQSVCTVAGLLLFGKNPNRFIPQAGIDAVAYPGYAKEYATGNSRTAIEPYIKTASKARETGLGINAGHDLDLNNLCYFVQQIPGLLEVSIGHALVCDAIYLGLENTVQLYKRQLK